MKLTGKVAVVTGSTRGIGAQTARQFAEAGAAVVVTGRSTQDGEAVAVDIRRAGGRAKFLKSDMCSESELKAVMDFAAKEFGKLNVLVNCAAATDELHAGNDLPMADLKTEQLKKVIDVGIYGLFWSTKYALPHMIAAGGGSIVNISSGVSIAGLPGQPGYAMTKGAMNAVTRQIAVDYAKANIRCNAIIVGVISGAPPTDFLLNHPVAGPALKGCLLTRVGRASDIANMAQYLASDLSEFMTGGLIPVAGGWDASAHLPDMSAAFADDHKH